MFVKWNRTTLQMATHVTKPTFGKVVKTSKIILSFNDNIETLSYKFLPGNSE